MLVDEFVEWTRALNVIGIIWFILCHVSPTTDEQTTSLNFFLLVECRSLLGKYATFGKLFSSSLENTSIEIVSILVDFLRIGGQLRKIY